MVRVIGLSPAAAAGVSVLLATTVALGVVYYRSAQEQQALPPSTKRNGSSNKKKGNNRPGSSSSKLSPTNKRAGANAKASTKPSKPEPMAVRILYGSQTGTSKRTSLVCMCLLCLSRAQVLVT